MHINSDLTVVLARAIAMDIVVGGCTAVGASRSPIRT
jgi:hypothetical protein